MLRLLLLFLKTKNAQYEWLPHTFMHFKYLRAKDVNYGKLTWEVQNQKYEAGSDICPDTVKLGCTLPHVVCMIQSLVFPNSSFQERELIVCPFGLILSFLLHLYNGLNNHVINRRYPRFFFEILLFQRYEFIYQIVIFPCAIFLTMLAFNDKPSSWYLNFSPSTTYG